MVYIIYRYHIFEVPAGTYNAWRFTEVFEMKRTVFMTFMFLIVLAFSGSSIYAETKTVSFERSAATLWCTSYFQWDYSDGKVNWSDAWQTGGAIFPNTLELKGASTTRLSDSLHKGTSLFKAGVGILTPWGGVNVYEENFGDYIEMKPNGYWVAWS